MAQAGFEAGARQVLETVIWLSAFQAYLGGSGMAKMYKITGKDLFNLLSGHGYVALSGTGGSVNPDRLADDDSLFSKVVVDVHVDLNDLAKKLNAISTEGMEPD